MDQINHLYLEKLNADAQDQQDGSTSSEFNVFTTELYLLESGMRRLAELRVYELLMATKEHLKAGGQCVRIFARMLGCLYSKEEGDKNSYIPSNIGSAVLYFRKRLLSLPEQWHKPIVVNHGVRVWLPIEPAVSLLKIALFYLPPRKLELQCRKIEENAAILSNGGKIVPQSEIVGARMDVRAAMRRAMIDSENAEQDTVVKESSSKRPRKSTKSVGGDGNENTNSNTKGNETLIVVDVNEILDIIIESLFGRKLSIADELKRLFVRGDENGDGVLSFNEFSQILKDLPRDKTDDQLSSRQALRIYRNALSYCGEGLDISKTTFVHICEKFNLIPLCDINKVELLEADLESKKIIATADGDATKLSTVIAAKESAAKGALLDLMRGIEAVKIAVDRAPAHIRSKLSRLIRHLTQTSTVCSADIPKVIPSFDATSIKTEAESYLTLQKAVSLFTPKGSSIPGGGRRQTINAITPASPSSGDSLRKHLLMKNSAKSMAISSSEGYSETNDLSPGEGAISIASVHPPMDESHLQKVPKKLESRKSLFFGDDETFKG
jgi:hypothetical protein